MPASPEFWNNFRFYRSIRMMERDELMWESERDRTPDLTLLLNSGIVEAMVEVLQEESFVNDLRNRGIDPPTIEMPTIDEKKEKGVAMVATWDRKRNVQAERDFPQQKLHPIITWNKVMIVPATMWDNLIQVQTRSAINLREPDWQDKERLKAQLRTARDNPDLRILFSNGAELGYNPQA